MDTKSTKEKIVDFATSLLRQKGYHGWSYEDISQEIGIKKASIHYYFPKKNDLVRQALQLYIQNFSTATGKILQKSISNTKKLEAYLELFKKAYDLKDMLCLCTSLAADCRTIPPAIQESIASFFVGQRNFIKSIIDNGIAAAEFKSTISSTAFADVILNCLQGLLLRGRLEREDSTFTACTNTLLELLKK